jgi:N-methylhydantoinase A
MAIIAGIDIGGTFTDVILVDMDAKSIFQSKTSSTHRDLSVGFLLGLKKTGIPIANIENIIHGTTIATNAILERKGAKCGLITTRGFKDILELRRRDRPQIYGLVGNFKPLIPRNYRFEVTERIDSHGQILINVSKKELRGIAKRLIKENIESIAIVFLHSYLNALNEQKAKNFLARIVPHSHITVSSDILPEIREFERTSTAVVNTYVQPLIKNYLNNLQKKLKKVDLFIMQSNGGIMSVDAAKKIPVNTILSGPAAGVIAASYIGQMAGYKNIISCDMGGTSLDVSVISEGKFCISSETKLDFGIPVRIPMIEVKTIGAGGGSIAWIDRGGILQIGPQSAGADPGPVCYGKGGTEPTVTDANLALGRINAAVPIGDEGFVFDLKRTKRVLDEKIGLPLGLGTYKASSAIVDVTNSKISNCIRMVSIERGYDPREFVLVAFGGAGPLHAGSIIKEAGISKAVIPYYPGLFSAFGCVLADVRHDFVQTVNENLNTLKIERVNEILKKQTNKGKDLLRREGIPIETINLLFEADMSYEGQTHSIRVPLPSSKLNKNEITDAFNFHYKKRYGSLLHGFQINLANLRVTIVGIKAPINLKEFIQTPLGCLKDSERGVRKVFFNGRFLDSKIYERGKIPIGAQIYGPAIIEQPDTTIVVEPDMVAMTDDFANLIISEMK